MMTEYISREVAKEVFCEYCDWAESGSESCKSCPDPIGKIPAADVVEVVRCKDCKYAQDGAVFGQDWCADAEIHPDFFCADGERKDNG